MAKQKYILLFLYTGKKKLAQTASREKCGPLVLNQSIHTSLCSAVSTQNLQFRRQHLVIRSDCPPFLLYGADH